MGAGGTRCDLYPIVLKCIGARGFPEHSWCLGSNGHISRRHITIRHEFNMSNCLVASPNIRVKCMIFSLVISLHSRSHHRHQGIHYTRHKAFMGNQCTSIKQSIHYSSLPPLPAIFQGQQLLPRTSLTHLHSLSQLLSIPFIGQFLRLPIPRFGR